MLTLDALKEWGANTEEGMGRMMNNEGFYMKMIGMFLAKPGLDGLADALAAGDKERAFEAAHAVKGVANNLSLTPIAAPVSEISDQLKAGVEMDYIPLLEEAQKQLDALQALAAD